jgi:hypothetical protein
MEILLDNSRQRSQITRLIYPYNLEVHDGD